MTSELPPQGNELILCTTPGGTLKVEVIHQGETFWLTQKQIAELFGVDVRTVSDHLQSIFSTGELQQDSVIRKFRITAPDGKNYLTNVYHLEKNKQ